MTKPQRMQLEVHYYDDNWDAGYFYLVGHQSSIFTLWPDRYGRALAPGCAGILIDRACSVPHMYRSQVDSRLIKQRLRLRKASKCQK